MELMRATYVRHAFPRHLHSTYVVQLVEDGADDFTCNGESFRAGPGCVVVINPLVVHTGRPAAGKPLCYRSLYPSRRLVERIARRLGDGDEGYPLFGGPVIDDPRLADELAAAHRALEADPGGAAAGRLVLPFFARLIREHAVGPPCRRDAGGANAAVTSAVRFLSEHVTEPVQLAQLAAVAGRSRFHLNRCFRQQMGLPPHEYHLSLRVELARRRLRDGVAPALVAQEAGFVDQSHLTRWFKRFVGVTPGPYARDRNGVQDAARAAG